MAKDDKFLTLARNRRKQAIEATADNRRVQLDDVKFAAGSPDNGWQWPSQVLKSRQNDPNGARPCLTINKLPQHVKLVTNEQRQNRPSVKVLPVDDKGDPEIAELLNGIIRHIEVNSDADVAYDTACDNQVTHGEGFFRIVTDYCDATSFEQDILIRRVRNSFSVDMDPNIQDPSGADAEWCFISDELTEDEFEKEYPKAEPISWDVVGQGDEFVGWFDGDTKKVRIAEYFWFKDEQKKLYLWRNGQTSFEGDPLPMGVSAVEKPLKERTTTVRTVMWTKMNGQEVLDEREWVGRYIPIIRVVGNEYEVDGKIIVSGLVRNAKDPQRMVNYWTSQEAEMLALAPKAPFVGASGQFEGHEDKWKTANTVNYAYLEYEPIVQDGVAIPPPQRQMPPLPPAGIINAKLGSSDDLQATVGQYNPSLGAESKEKSGKAIVARQRQADVGTFHYIDNLSRAIRHCGRILVDMIPKIYDTERVARIVGEDGEPEQARINPDQEEAVRKVQHETGEIEKIYNPGVGKYDVAVTVGPSFTTKRQEAAEAMAQVLQGNPGLWQAAGDLFVKNLDWPGADELAKRLRKMVPPQLLEDDEDEGQNIEAKAAQLAQAEQMLVAKEQQLAAAAQEMGQAEARAKAEIQAADKAKAEMQRLVDRLNSQQEAMTLKSQIMQKEFDLQSAELERDKAKIVGEMKEMVSRFESKIAVLMAEPDGDEDPSKTAEQESQRMMAAQMHQQVMETLGTAIRLISAPRQQTLQMGPDGMPIGSISTIAETV